ncbi:MAG: PepSY domain-containing protein [Paracoccaceae bacterium]
MRKTLTIGTFLALLGAAGIARAEDDCWAPMADWHPREAVQEMAEAQGWTVRRIKIDDGCYEINGTDAQGRQIEVTVNPATLAIMEIEFEDEEEDDDHGRTNREKD